MNFEEFCKLVEIEGSEIVVNSLLLEGSIFYFKQDHRRYFNFKNKISEKLSIHPNNIEVIGSARLGFRLKSEKLGKPFGADSDIDVVIVSNDLFEKAWSELIYIKERWWHDLSPRERTNLRECQEHIWWGYIRPDRIPSKAEFSKRWWTIFEQLSDCDDYERRKIRGRLFKSWKHAQINYCYSIERLMQEHRDLSKEG